MAGPAEAKRGILVYGVLVVIGSGVCQIAIARSSGGIEEHPLWVAALMWSPGLAALATRLLLREGVRDVSFRPGGARSVGLAGLALGFPILVGLLAYGVAWASGLAAFEDRPLHFLWSPESPAARLALRVLLSATLGLVMGSATALGEEIGWRGYLLLKLIDAQVPRPVLVSGVVWGLWHTPLILTGQYAAGPYPALSTVVFLFTILPSAYLHAWVRLRSGSLWPAVVAHAGWNAIIQGVFDRQTVGGGASRTPSIWVGESGLLVAATSALVALLVLRGPWVVRRRPADAPEPLSRP